MAASIRNTPRSEILYGIGSGLNRIKQALNAQRQRSPIEQQIATGTPMSLGDLLLGEIPEALQDWSYEGSRGPISGRNIQTLKVDPRAVEIAALAIPGGKPAATAARKLAPDAAKLVEKYAVEPYQFNVIKPEGGQWMSDEKSGIERLLRNLRELPYDDDLARAAGATEEDIARAQPRKQQAEAHNKWLDTTLKKYIKQRMATPSDEIRKLADQGITHITKETLDERAPHIARLTNTIKDRADYAGIPYEQVATTNAGQTWENLADYGVYPNKVEDLTSSAEPWMSNLDPKEIVHHLAIQRADEYGFDHMMDVLRQDLETGRIRPENINKLSVEQMVRRTHEYDQEMAKRMEKEAVKEQAGLPVVKEYPEQGFKWLELNAPDNPDLTAKVLEYEGNKMGHCVGGYCDNVKSGDTQIFSLRDAKGEPHVTIEVRPQRSFGTAHLEKFRQQAQEEALASGVNPGTADEPSAAFLTAVNRNMDRLANENLPMVIQQIKGKQNRAPKEEYLPFVQDFVKSGNWESVGDISNAGLVDLEEAGVPEIMRGGNRYATQQEYSDIIERAAKEAGFAAGGLVSGDYDDTRIDALADDLLQGYAKGGAVEEESITKRIPRYVRKSQYKMADVVGLKPEVEFATEIPERYFPANEQHLGRGDAMRHLLLQAQLQQKYGDLGAYLIGAGHELLGGGQSEAEEAQDEYNDRLGREIGRQSKDRAEAAYRALQTVQLGKAKVLSKEEQRNNYAEGGLVYDDSRVDELADQLLGM